MLCVEAPGSVSGARGFDADVRTCERGRFPPIPFALSEYLPPPRGGNSHPREVIRGSGKSLGGLIRPKCSREKPPGITTPIHDKDLQPNESGTKLPPPEGPLRPVATRYHILSADPTPPSFFSQGSPSLCKQNAAALNEVVSSTPFPSAPPPCIQLARRWWGCLRCRPLFGSPPALPQASKSPLLKVIY